MNSIEDCLNKVKNDCYKFIKTQEISSDKFKKKDKMLKAFLIPISFWIAKKTNRKKPLIVGLTGGQGTGKTTISSILMIILKKYFKLNTFKISIDDIYKTREDRVKLSKKIHPLLLTRGVPGTHDLNYLSNFLKKINSRKFQSIKLPRFDKAKDDRFPKTKWYKINKRPDIIIFEGWCVGARPERLRTLNKHVNLMEKVDDNKLIWRKYVNTQLKKNYKELFSKIDCLLFLRAQNFRSLQKWRVIQEKKLKIEHKNKKTIQKIMTRKEVLDFMQTYQRITQNMFKTASNYASIVLKLNSNHQINSVKYNQ
tara:strand:- start:1471 stop:2400 length:930 start_codon:yes stop_codon:yes gene_type:complete